MGCFSMPVRYPSELKRGDHIMWKRPLAYDHHAIVEEVNGNEVQVIEFGSPGGGSSSGKGKVCTNKIHGVDKMYRYVYDDCDDPDDVLQRAQAKLKERLWSEIYYEKYMTSTSHTEKSKCLFKYCISKLTESFGVGGYNPLWNNCEHLASECKTGNKSSRQVSSFALRSGISAANSAVGGFATVMSRFIAVCSHEGINVMTAFKELIEIIFRGGSECGKNVGKLGLKLGCKSAVLGISCVIIEGILFCWNWKKANQLYNQRMKLAECEEMRLRLYKEWKKDMIEAGAEAVGGVIGAVVGGLIGSVLSGFGTAIGAAVGSV